MDRTPVYLIFFTGFLLGVGFMVELKGLEHYTTALAVNYHIVKPMMNQIFGYVFIGLMFFVCLQAIRPSTQTVVVTHEEMKP